MTGSASEETIVVAPFWLGEGYGGGTKVASMEEAIAEAKHLAEQGYGKGKSIIHIVRTTRTVIEWNSDHSDLAALPRPEADEGAVAVTDAMVEAALDAQQVYWKPPWRDDPFAPERKADMRKAISAALAAAQEPTPSRAERGE